jgi:hypothetical protein
MACALELDPRPPEHAAAIAAAARALLFHEDGEERPPWWIAARNGPGARAVTGDIAAALTQLAASIPPVFKGGNPT